MKTRTRLAAAALALAAAVGGSVAGASSAQAASYGYVYVVANSSCGVPYAQVKAIQITNVTIGWTLPIDSGDNIVYPRVVFGQSNQLVMNLWCYVGSRQVGYTSVTKYITPTAYNQTFWLN